MYLTTVYLGGQWFLVLLRPAACLPGDEWKDTSQPQESALETFKRAQVSLTFSDCCSAETRVVGTHHD